ncbi:hypothetical protein BY458DRAFT_86050 [Sporodiniella umbellata]|nr:hypothetical protein BY458DRAFT_86050 [Sporodiniella umbellata]
MGKQYTQILEKYYETLEQSYDQSAKTERAMMYEIMSIFKLCQLLYFSDKTCDSEDLIQWQNETFYPLLWQYDRHAIYIDLLEHQDFWPFAFRLAIFGQKKILVDLFSRVMPSREWKHLYDQIQRILNGNCSLQVTASTHPAYTVCLILTGDAETISQYAIHPAQCFLIDRLRGRQRISPEGVLESLLADNIYQALTACINYDPWLLAHLTILLDHKKILTTPVVIDKTEIGCRDYFVLIYSACLKHTHWEEAFVYLLSCGDLGKQAIQQHLKTIEFDEKAVDFCKKHNMKKEGLLLYEVFFYELLSCKTLFFIRLRFF